MDIKVHKVQIATVSVSYSITTIRCNAECKSAYRMRFDWLTYLITIPNNLSNMGPEAEPVATSKLVFAAAGCNRNTACIRALPSRNMVVYAANGNVLVMIDSGRKVSAALPFHSDSITSISIVDSPQFVFITASSSGGQVSVWFASIQNSIHSFPWSHWNPLHCWNAHSGPVIDIDAYWDYKRSVLIIGSVGFDSRLCVWTCAPELEHELMSECLVSDCPGAKNSLPKCIALCSDLEDRECEHYGGKIGALVAAGGTHERLQIFRTDNHLCNLSFAGSLLCHRDWILDVNFSPLVQNSLGEEVRYIATASKDAKVRIWSLKRIISNQNDENSKGDDTFSYLGAPRISFQFSGFEWQLSSFALLEEHEKAVSSVLFESQREPNGIDVPRLMTSSMDCSIAIWEMVDGDYWDCGKKFGLLGGDTAHALGFFGAVFGSLGCVDVVGNNFGGAIHCWRAIEPNDDDLLSMTFEANNAPSGHFAAVTDFDWDPLGQFFITSSEDKTVRIFLERNCIAGIGLVFVECARPQTHGHSVHTLAVCNLHGTRYVSGSEESMIRMFEAPYQFIMSSGLSERDVDTNARIKTAVVPELGLSNKAVYGKEETGMEMSESDIVLEEELKLKTLWPEIGKLYGHGNHVSSIAVCHKTGIMASACQAQKSRDAGLRLWNLETNIEEKHLLAHDLTVTRLQFSEDGQGLLSVSRDRSFAIHVTDGHKFDFRLHCRQKNAHTRLLSDGAWLFNRDFICTCGRDKRLRFFSIPEPNKEVTQEKECVEVQCIKFASGISAVSALRLKESNESIVAVGFEDGNIRILRATRNSKRAQLHVVQVGEVPHRFKCSARVSRVQWRPGSNSKFNRAQLGIASDDHTVRVIEVEF